MVLFTSMQARRLVSRLYFSLVAIGFAFVAVALLSLSVAQATANAPDADIQIFEAFLNGPAEPNHPDTVATGHVVMALSEDETTLFYYLSVSDIMTVTASHIHVGAPGVNGPVIVDLLGSNTLAPDSPVRGSATLTPTQVAALKAGDYYVNVHTPENPGGEIRGQLDAYTPATSYHALLLGRNEVPTPVDTPARGLARVALSGTNTLSYTVYVTDITGITAAHIHIGSATEAGPVAYLLYGGGGSFGPGNPISGTVALDAEQVVNFLSGNHYINVHTTTNSGGEIRGQIDSVSTFWAALSGAHEVPPVASTASGKAILALNGAADALSYRVMVSDIDGINAAHIHKAPAGTNGPVIFPLFGGSGSFDASHPVSGTLPLDWMQVLDLIGGNYYINVHTSAHGSGEIRGQVGKYTPSIHYTALLLGRNEVPAKDVPGAGLARLVLNDNQGTLNYTLAVTDISGISAAHIHLAPQGVNGPVIVGLYGGSPAFDAANPVGGGTHLTAQNVVDMLTGYYYVNVHTTANPGGEIRGQVGRATLFQAMLSGADEVPPVATDASGKAVLALNDLANELVYRVGVSNIISVTAAHIHLGATGTNGPVVFLLFGGSGTFDASHPVSGSVSLNTSQVLDLLQDDYYINVHTSAHGSGEIRGQVMAHAPESSYTVNLRGSNEVPPVDTTATGTATLRLDGLLNLLQYQVTVADIDNVTASHIHKGVEGANGPVLFHLFGGAGSFGPDAPIAGYLAVNAENLVDFLSDYYYINVHSTDHPSGEIRGQIDAGFIESQEATYLPLISR